MEKKKLKLAPKKLLPVRRSPSHLVSDGLGRSDLPPVAGFISTGCTILDLAISGTHPGGFAVGRINHIWGPESSAKTVLLAEPLGSAQRQGGQSYLVDVEGTYDFERGELVYGVDSKLLNYYRSTSGDRLTIEQFFDDYLPTVIAEIAGNDGPHALGVDSLTALTTKPEAEKRMDEGSYGTRAKVLSEAFRKYIWILNEAKLTTIFIDQARDKMNNTGKTFSGGNALRFYATTRVYLEKVQTIRNKYQQAIGIVVKFIIDKNKIAPPFREGEFLLYFDYGIDDIGTCINWLKKMGEESKSAWFSLPFAPKKFNSLTSAVAWVEENNLEDALRQTVVQRWGEVYSTDPRKPKERHL